MLQVYAGSNPYDETVLEVKDRLRVVILGPYRPSVAKKKLIWLRNQLIRNGYSKAALVEDLDYRPRKSDEDPDMYFTEKSNYYIEHYSDVLFFVFLCNGDLSGLTRELSYVCYRVPDRIKKCVVFFQQRCYEKISTQIRGIVKGFLKMSQRFFKDRQALLDDASASCFEYLFTLYNEIMTRGPD